MISVGGVRIISNVRTIQLGSNFEYSPLFGLDSGAYIRIWGHFALFCLFPISNTRHYSVGSEYSHYSVGFEFQVFATIRSEANIRLRN